jgi:putative MATE family efflux protein
VVIVSKRKEACMFSRNDLKKLIVPLIIEQFLAVAVGLFDTVMIAPDGEAAVSGISLVDTINTLLISIFSALATGGAVVSAQFLGHEDNRNACKAADQLAITMLMLSVSVSFLSIIFNNGILNFLYRHTDADILGNAYIYFYVTAASYPFIALYNAGAALFRAMGNSKISMKVSVVMNLTNIVGNAITIYILKISVLGAALSTFLSRMLAAFIICFLLYMRQDLPLHFNRNIKLSFDYSVVKKILNIGVPNGLENGIFQIGKLLVASLVATFGAVSISANAVAGTVCSFGCIPGNAIGLAMIPVVGQCIGAGKPEEARRYAIKLMKIAYVSLISVNLLIIFFVNPICSIYALSVETRTLAKKIMIWHCANGCIIWPCAFTLPNALRAASDVKYTMVASMITMWACRIGLSYFFALFCKMGVFGVWVAMTTDWYVRALFYIIRFLGGRWKSKAKL